MDTTAVVTYLDALDATLLDQDLDTARTRIETVFGQFLDHGGRTLHDLAGSNLVDEDRGQSADTAGFRG